MTKEFVPYTLALKLKELGFDEPCFSIWKNDKLISVGGHWGMNITHSMFGFEGDMFALDECRAPTFSQAFRFFREKYKPEELNFYIHLLNTYSTPKHYLHCYTIRRGVSVIEVATRDTYEEAELACLDKLIELVESELK
jgi:hypothetical protein